MIEIDPLLFADDAVAPETARFNAEIEATLAGLPATHEVPVEATRRAREEGRGIFPPGGPLPGSEWMSLPGGVEVRLSAAEAPRGIYLHLHGGGWSVGSPAYHDAMNQRIAREAGLSVVSLRYRLAPENPWPAAIEDARAAFDRCRERWPGLPVALGGESAGAHLSACLLLDLRARGRLSAVAGAVLNYGMYDLRMTASMANWGDRKLVLSTPSVDWFVSNLLPDRGRRGDPSVSPLLAELSEMPPALFQVGTLDPLLDDTLMMATRWAGAGRSAELVIWPGGIHGFDSFDLPIAEAFRRRQIDFLNRLA